MTWAASPGWDGGGPVARRTPAAMEGQLAAGIGDDPSRDHGIELQRQRCVPSQPGVKPQEKPFSPSPRAESPPHPYASNDPSRSMVSLTQNNLGFVGILIDQLEESFEVLPTVDQLFGEQGDLNLGAGDSPGQDISRQRTPGCCPLQLFVTPHTPCQAVC